MGRITNKYLLDYIEMVEKGKIKTCPEQKQLIRLVKRVFKQEDIYTDDEIMERYMALQRFFPYKLFPWEKFCFCLHMCTFCRDGTLRWPELLIYVTRGAGKNGYLSFEDFACASPVHGVRNYHISTYAAGEENAKRSFDELYDILESDKNRFKSAFRWNKQEIQNYKTGSKITFKTSNADTKDGGREGKINFDEIHAYKDFKLYNVAKTGLGKKPFCRITYTSTQGFNRGGLLDTLLERSRKILSGDEEDDGLLPFMCELHTIEDVKNPEKWDECNPSLIYFPDLRKQYKRELKDYIANPGANTSFPIKRCNFYVDPVDAIARREDLEFICKGEKAENLEILRGSKAILGIDYAEVNDMLSVGLLIKKDNIYYWITHSWICKQSRDFHGIKFNLEEAERNGELTIVDEASIDGSDAVEWVIAMQKKLDLKIIAGGTDFAHMTNTREAVAQLGLKTERRRPQNNMGKKQGICYWNRTSNNAAALPFIFKLITDHKIYCGDNKTMLWCLGNVVKKETNNAMSLEKIEPRFRKTDAVLAMLAAFCVMVDFEEPQVKKKVKLPHKRRKRS